MARWLQLATVAADGTPRLRTLVFRGRGGPASLDLLTDSRSAKADELARQPAVELCWLLPRARCQFRLRGVRQALEPPLEGQERQRHWGQLSPGARAVWSWPAPGSPLEADMAFPGQEDATEPPACFQLLRLELSRVELLDLAPHPHRRCRWRAAAGWREEPLTP